MGSNQDNMGICGVKRNIYRTTGGYSHVIEEDAHGVRLDHIIISHAPPAYSITLNFKQADPVVLFAGIIFDPVPSESPWPKWVC